MITENTEDADLRRAKMGNVKQFTQAWKSVPQNSEECSVFHNKSVLKISWN